jgi:hypothetical protein
MDDHQKNPGYTIRQILSRSDALISRIARGEVRERVVVEPLGDGHYVGRVVTRDEPPPVPPARVRMPLPIVAG